MALKNCPCGGTPVVESADKVVCGTCEAFVHSSNATEELWNRLVERNERLALCCKTAANLRPLLGGGGMLLAKCKECGRRQLLVGDMLVAVKKAVGEAAANLEAAQAAAETAAVAAKTAAEEVAALSAVTEQLKAVEL